MAEIGSGGMGDVSVAVAQGPAGFSKLLVLKRLRSSLGDDPEFRTMFLREARLAAQLSHPNIVQTNEVGFDGQRYFIAMEYLDGQSLLAVIRKNAAHKFTLPMHVRVLAEVLSGLHYAHELLDLDGKPLGLVHRDATPHNVFITYDGQVKVVDFGIAKAGDGDTATGMLKGKVPYMSPEQVDGSTVDRQTDVFAVGVMLWEAIAGARMWKGLNDMQVMNRLANGEIHKPSSVTPDVDERLEAIAMRALAVRKEERYQTAAEMQAALEHYLDETGERVTAREIGRCVGELFEDTRSQIRQVIDAQLRLLRVAPATVDSQSGSRRATLARLPSALDSSSGSTPLQGQENTGDKQSATLSSTAEQPNRWRGFIPLAVAAAIASMVMVILMRGKPQPEVTPAASPPPAIASVEPAPQPAPSPIAPAASAAVPQEFVRLTVEATPKEAKLFLDDAPLGENPHSSKVVRDGTSHHVRAEAPGYATKSSWVVFDQAAVNVNLSLSRAPTAAGPTSKPTAGPAPEKPAATAPPEPAKTAKPKSATSIDKEDPWKK